MIDNLSIKNRKSERSDLTANLRSTQKSLNQEISLPQIMIQHEEPKLQNLLRAVGDQIDINPETERKKTLTRKDMFQNEIQKGSKNHKISFRDQIAGQSLQQIQYFVKEPQEDLDECCPCIIY